MKKIIVGILIGCLLLTYPVLAESILQTIEVVFDTVQVQINGEDIDTNSILYNGTTYLPMRKLAEVLDKDVEWNQETMTANIKDKELPGVIERGFDDKSYGVKFTDGFGIVLNRQKQSVFGTNDCVQIAVYTDGVKDKSTITIPAITGQNNMKAREFELISFMLQDNQINDFKKIDFFENFSQADSMGFVYFREEPETIYYDDGVHKCTLYFEK